MCQILRFPVTTPCHHHFCADCVKTWLKRSTTCPCCREQLYTTDAASLELFPQEEEHDEDEEDGYAYDFTPDDFARLQKILEDFIHGRGRSGAYGTTLLVRRWDKETWRPYKVLHVRLNRSGSGGGWVFRCDEDGEMSTKEDRVKDLLRRKIELHSSIEWAAEVR